jgi:hypothetical protein
LASEPKKTGRGIQPLGSTVFYLVLVLVICALWLPVFLAYYVPGITVTDRMVQQARESPSDAILEELRDFHFLIIDWKNRQELIDAASGMLEGNMRVGTCSTRFARSFSAQDLSRISPDCDFLFAAFVVPDVLLQAYDATGRKEFFIAAQAFITSAQAIEQAALLPPGEFWNDHAVATRICVLANFWRLYRHSPDYRPEVGRQVLQMVARSEQLLAKPGLFTYATNHGIVQNLGLWHASLAFPPLPRAEQYQRLARGRLTDQLKFFVSGEGVVLEHSAGYHLFGLELFGMAFRYLDLLHEPAPPDWMEKYQRAEKFYAALRRPDGSLPMVGDTGDETIPLGPLVTSFDRDGRSQRLAYQPVWKPEAAVNLYPVSGYAIWWDGLKSWPNPQSLAQTVVGWSYFVGHGHKHADEMSVLFWAGGQTWLSNIGYWPYENEWRGMIESWTGSNAPHLVQEPLDSIRSTRLVSSGSSGKLTALELERTGAENYVAQRQVIHRKPDLWLVLDNTSGSEKSRTSTTWTSAPDVLWQQGQIAGAFRLTSPRVGDSLDMFFLGSENTQQSLLRGSSRPFAGWQIEHHRPTPASALVVEQPARNSWAATVWTWERKGVTARFDAAPQMTHWADATHWEMQLPNAAGAFILRREGNRLHLHSGRDDSGRSDSAANDEVLELTAPSPEISPALAELHNQFMASASRYPVFSVNSNKREKVTYLLLGIFLLQQIFFLGYKRMQGPHLERLRFLNLVAWIVGGIWLTVFYF